MRLMFNRIIWIKWVRKLKDPKKKMNVAHEES